MDKFKLVVPGYTKEFDNVVKGFAEAENRAFMLYEEHRNEDPDIYVACFNFEEPVFQNNFLSLGKDCFGDIYWRKMKVSNGLPLYEVLLSETEKRDLQKMREEREKRIYELSFDELKGLREQICVGSCFLSDYKNSFGIDEDEVSDYSDGYIDYLQEEASEKGIEELDDLDTPDAFAEYCMNVEYVY